MKRVLIVYSDEWIAYSPSVLNLIRCLKNDDMEVDTIAFDNDVLKNKEKESNNIRYIDLKDNVTQKLMKFKMYKLFKVYKLVLEINKLKHKNFDYVFGIDAVGFIAARLFYGKEKVIHFSLETVKNFYWKVAKALKIKKLIIQTKERADFLDLGEDKELKTVYIQNSPISGNVAEGLDYCRREKKMIYFGLISKIHGVEYCIDALDDLKDYKLEVRGLCPDESYLNTLKEKYRNLISEGRLFFTTEYVDQDKVLEFIKDFYIGFCFYDFDLISKNDFNYLSCPSGKLFNYYASAVPVIGSDIIGLKSVKDFNAGILLEDPNALIISEAVKKIEGNYENYAKNSLTASIEFDYRKGYNEMKKRFF